MRVTDIEQEARAEAEKGWPAGHEDGRVRDIRSGARDGFVAGVVWQAGRASVDALDFLDEMNAAGRIQYADYSTLHDLIAGASRPASHATRETVTEEMVGRAQQSLLSSVGWIRESYVRDALEAALTEKGDGS